MFTAQSHLILLKNTVTTASAVKTSKQLLDVVPFLFFKRLARENAGKEGGKMGKRSAWLN